jgi:hypothetical protein
MNRNALAVQEDVFAFDIKIYFCISNQQMVVEPYFQKIFR